MLSSEEETKTEKVKIKPLTLNRKMFNHFIIDTENKMKYLDQVTCKILAKS